MFCVAAAGELISILLLSATVDLPLLVAQTCVCLVLQVMCNSATHTHTHALAISWFEVSSSCISTTTMCHTDIIIMTWGSFTVRAENAALPQKPQVTHTHTQTETHSHTCLYQVRISPSSIALPCPGSLPLPPAPAASFSTAGTHPCVGNFRQFSRFSAASIAHFT